MTKIIPWLGGMCLLFVLSAAASAQIITNQPQSLTVNIASTATFTVGASNAVRYQWQFNGSSLAGATNSSLTLEDVMTDQQGSYTVVVIGSNAPATTSSPAVLTIVPGVVVTFKLSGFPNGGTSNIDVELFSHDKPITVQNFIHYVEGGGFTNMFFQRCVPGFVLQGGVFGTTDRTNTNPPLTGWEILSEFINATNIFPPYPHQIESEFNIGPLIHNRFGTIAMALTGAGPNSGSSSFFFNLVDNSGPPNNLDGSDFTVFGRILDGTNVLNYFNTLSTGQGIVTTGEILTNGVPDTSGQLTELPVNYSGTKQPANANLVFCDFLVTNPPVDTIPPTVTITSPATNTLLTNSLAGMASDNIGVADVIVLLTPEATGGVYPSPYTNGTPVTNIATGTTNWSLPLSAGVYNVTVESQDGAGNLSQPATEVITNTAIVFVGGGMVQFTNAALTNFNPVGYPLQYGTNYGLVAVPGSTNQTFVGWSGAYSTMDATTNFTYDGSVLTATFITNLANGTTITYPTNGAGLSSVLFDITGTINNSVLTALPVAVTAQIFTNSASNFSVTLPQSTTTSTTNWAIGVTNYLPSGSYTIQVLATDHSGNQTLVTENFTFTADTNGPTVVITNPAPGALLYLGGPLLIQGTAHDNLLPVTNIVVNMVPQAAADGTFPNGGENFANPANGTTNWSLDLNTLGEIPPGSYILQVYGQNAAGVSNAPVSQPLTISAILVIGNGPITLTQGTNAKANPTSYPLQMDQDYILTATPGPGQAFLNWNDNGYITTNHSFSFEYQGGLLTATFVSNTAPKGLKITYPPPNARVATNSFLMKGTIAGNVGAIDITCQISSLTTGLQAGPVRTTTGTKTWSISVTNLPPDGYLVQVTGSNAAGFSSVISEDFAVLDFKSAAGTYNGLFICNTGPVTSTNSGMLTLTLTDSGSFSARLYFPAYPTQSLGGYFIANGEIVYPYQIFPDNPLRMNLFLDLTNGTDSLTGTLNGQTWSSDLVLYRAATKLSAHTTPATGKYVLSLNPTNWGNTNGYATVSVSGGGALAVTGTLPDGATFSQSARVSTNGVWPLYAMPTGYRTNGMLMGWETNDASGASSGQLYWFKSAGVGSYYSAGVNTNVGSTGTNYSAPAAGNYSIIFEGGSLTSPLTNELTVARAGGPFKAATAADKLALSVSPTGALTGHFLNPGDNKTLQFKGAFFSQSQGGSGFFLERDGQTGHFSLNAE